MTIAPSMPKPMNRLASYGVIVLPKNCRSLFQAKMQTSVSTALRRAATNSKNTLTSAKPAKIAIPIAFSGLGLLAEAGCLQKQGADFCEVAQRRRQFGLLLGRECE